MIRLTNVHRSFGPNHVLRGASLEIRDGETLTIIGGSGTGKSVTLKLMVGLLKPDSGQVYVDDQEISHLKDEQLAEVQKKFAYVLDSIRDTDQKLVKLTGVTVSPEVAVMRGTRLLYRGRVDDRYIELGQERANPTRRDLEAALDLITTGRPVAVKQTRAVGCILADLMK